MSTFTPFESQLMFKVVDYIYTKYKPYYQNRHLIQTDDQWSAVGFLDSLDDELVKNGQSLELFIAKHHQRAIEMAMSSVNDGLENVVDLSSIDGYGDNGSLLEMLS